MEDVLSRKIVVLTPVKNEAWILPLFCKSTSIWADYIVIADQGSTDGSREIASQFPKVELIDNNSADLDENYRDRILITKARELVGNNGILFRIDADEIFTPNFNSTDWAGIKRSPAGTFWRFKWLQLTPKLKSYWENGTAFGAFVDDGREYSTHGIIHARELFPRSEDDKSVVASHIQLLHFQFTDWTRMQSKHRYYQCFEHINFPSKSAIDIYRTYHWMYNKDLPIKQFPLFWIEEYSKYGINPSDITIEKKYWWDKKVEEYIAEYTPRYFRHIETYKPGELLHATGKNSLDKILLAYLNATKTTYNQRSGIKKKVIIKIDNILRNKLHL